MSRSVLMDYARYRTPEERQIVVDYLVAQSKELQLRRAFHSNPTPEILTLWCDAKEKLEQLKVVSA